MIHLFGWYSFRRTLRLPALRLLVESCIRKVPHLTNHQIVDGTSEGCRLGFLSVSRRYHPIQLVSSRSRLRGQWHGRLRVARPSFVCHFAPKDAL